MSKGKRIICGIDIGTTKVIAAISELSQTGAWNLLGFGQVPCRGLKKGVVVDIETTKLGIMAAVSAAQQQAGIKVEQAIVGVAGKHIRCINSYGIVGIQGETVTELDIARVIEAARAVALPDNERTLHVLPQEYFIDGQEGIKDPMNMSGVRLEAKVHIVVGSDSAVQNIINCVEQCGIDVQDVVLEQLASSHAVLTKDEIDQGVCMVDIGGGTADIAVFAGGAIRYSSAIPVAGDQVSNDLAIVLKTDAYTADKIKIDHADLTLAESDIATTIITNNAFEGKGSQEHSLKLISQIVYARYEELFVLIHDQLRRCGFHDKIKSGVVLTGGGSLVKGGVYLASKVFGMPVRIAKPKLPQIKDTMGRPECSTSVGLIEYYASQMRPGAETVMLRNDKLLNKMKKWLAENF